MKTYLYFFIILNFRMEGIALIDVIRKREGDIERIFACESGTIIVRQDETHALYCANTLKEAGCDLVFVDSADVGFVPSDRSSFNGYEITSPTGNLCANNNKPFIGDVFIQNYPKNLKENVWSNNIGIEAVTESLNFTEIRSNKIKVEFSKQWGGILLKIFVNCSNNQAIRNDDSARRCVLVKYEGYAKYPITSETFNLSPPTSTKPPTLTQQAPSTVTDATVRVAAIISDNDDTLVYALLAAFLSGFFLLAIFITVVVICKRKMKTKMNGSGVKGNEQDVEQRHQPSRLSHSSYQSRTEHDVRNEHMLQISPVVNTDSRTPTGSNTYAIETCGALPKTDIYIGEEESVGSNLEVENELASTSNYSKNSGKWRMKRIKLGADKKSILPQRNEIKNIYDDKQDECVANIVTSPEVMSSRFMQTSSPRDTQNNTVSLSPRVKEDSVESSNRTLGMSDRISQLQQHFTLAQTNTAYHDDEVIEREKPLYVEGHIPSDREDNVSATSESIEAMFSFSNELDDTMDELSEEDKNIEEKVDFSSFLTKKKHKRNPLFQMSHSEDETEDVLMF